MSDLADRIILSPSRLTHLVDRLQRDGLVAREVDDADARGMHAVLTTAGLERLRAARTTHHDVVRSRFIGRLSPADLGRLRRIWRRVLDPEIWTETLEDYLERVRSEPR